jgi:hypothetical protein
MSLMALQQPPPGENPLAGSDLLPNSIKFKLCLLIDILCEAATRFFSEVSDLGQNLSPPKAGDWLLKSVV